MTFTFTSPLAEAFQTYVDINNEEIGLVGVRGKTALCRRRLGKLEGAGGTS